MTGALSAAQDLWMDHYVKGVGAAPPEGVTAYTETCPSDAPSGGPYTSSNWATAAKGEIRLDDPAPKTIDPACRQRRRSRPRSTRSVAAAPARPPTAPTRPAPPPTGSTRPRPAASR